MLDELRDGESDTTLRNERFSSHVTINTKPTQERSRSRDRDRSSLGISGYQLPKQPGVNDYISSQLINSSDDISAYGTSSFLANNRPSSETQSILHRIDRALSVDRSSTDRRTEEYLSASRRTASPSQ
jgi:hypothetical protein